MPLSIPTLYQTLLSSGTSFSVAGISYNSICLGLSEGLYTWIINPVNLQLTGVTTGTGPGTGNVSGLISFVPNISLFITTLNSYGFNGVTTPLLGSAILAGLSTIINTQSSYVGISAGVWSGVDNSIVSISNGFSLYTLLYGYFTSTVGNGILVQNLSQALGFGIASQLQTAIGTGTVTPQVPIDVYPVTGSSNSSII